MSAVEALAKMTTRESRRFVPYRDIVPPPQHMLVDAVLMGVV